MANVEGLETVDALAFARLQRSDWNSAIVRGIYTAAPTTVAGRVRLFDVDHLIAAFVLGHLWEREVMPAFAAQIANDVHRLVRKDHSIMRLSAWKVIPRKGKPRVVVAEASPAPAAIELFRFEVADIRMAALDGIREKLRQRAAEKRQSAP